MPYGYLLIIEVARAMNVNGAIVGTASYRPPLLPLLNNPRSRGNRRRNRHKLEPSVNTLMNITSLGFAYLVIFTSFASGQSSTQNASVDSVMTSTDPIDRENKIQQIVESQRETHDQNTYTDINNHLKTSLSPEYNIDDRAAIIELAGKTHDVSAIPFLIENLTATNSGPSIGGLGRASFEGQYPYAAGLVYFGKDALPAMLAAAETSSDPVFNKVAETVIEFMDKPVVLPLLDEYTTTKQGSKSATIIRHCLQRMVSSSELTSNLEARLSMEKNADKHQRLIQLKSDLNVK